MTKYPTTIVPVASTPRSTGTDGPKLRDSCHACSSSKVRCNREKPTCSRCAKRGLTCEYLATKRAGRARHNSRQTNSANVTSTLPESSWPPPLNPSLLTPSSPVRPSLSHEPGNLDTLSYSLPSGEPCVSSSLSSLTAVNIEFDSLITLPTPFPVLATSTSDIHSQSLPQPHCPSSSSFAGFNHGLPGLNDTDILGEDDIFSLLDPDFSSDLSSLSKLLTPTNTVASSATSSDVSGFQKCRSVSFDGCLSRALGVFKELLSNTTTSTSTRLKKHGHENSPSKLPTIQAIVVENEQTIDAICVVLQCPCSQDIYLLTILSLITFKVLDWYAAAVQETVRPSGCSGPNHATVPEYSHNSLTRSDHGLECLNNVNGHHTDDEEPSHLAAQLVLGELHRAQRLINQLAKRFKEHRVCKEGMTTVSSATCISDSLSSTGVTTSPFSDSMLDHLEIEIRKRLRSLSSEIIDMLRKR